MPIIINKSGQTINDVSYGYLYVKLQPSIENKYDRVSIQTTCYNGLDVSLYGFNGWWEASTAILDPSIGFEDVSIWNKGISSIIPANWERFDPIKISLDNDVSEGNLIEWAESKTLEELTTTKSIPYEYMAYEDDVLELDSSTGEAVLDPCTNEPIKLHVTGDLIKKKNGTYQFYTKVLSRFCEVEDVSIF